MRTASAIMMSVLLTATAHADIVRLITVPSALLGTWAEDAQQCATKDKSNVLIESANYGDGSGSCVVRWIVETAGDGGADKYGGAARSRGLQPARDETT